MAKTAEKSAPSEVREFRAEARFQRTSPQKAKLVLDTIKLSRRRCVRPYRMRIT